MSAPEVHVAQVTRRIEGLELRLTVTGADLGKGAVVARLDRSGHVNEVHIGDESWSDYIDRGEPLTARDDVVGTIARKAREFALILRHTSGRRAA